MTAAPISTLTPEMLAALQDAPPEMQEEIQVLLRSLEEAHRHTPPTFAEFLSLYVYTDDGGGMKFNPWPWQVDLAAALPQMKQALFLKGRQIGMTWILAAYAVYVALYVPGAKVLILSQTEPDAKALLERVQVIYEFLPAVLKPENKHVIANTQMLKFRDRKSEIVALPTTPRAGRGRTAKLVIADEHAQHEYAERNFGALEPTAEAGGQFFILSSAEGVGNCFSNLWAAFRAQFGGYVEPEGTPGGEFAFGDRLNEGIAKLKRKQWLPVFLPYCVRPGRDEQWWLDTYDAKPLKLRHLVHQEYPREPDEAFQQSGRNVFDSAYLKIHLRECNASEPLPQEEWPENLLLDEAKIPVLDQWGEWPDIKTRLWNRGELKVWAPPVENRLYLAGADVAEGLAHGDYNDLVIFDSTTFEEVVSLHGHWPPDEYATLIDRLSRVYPGLYGVERNNHGHAVLVACKALMTPGLYRERPVYGKLGQVLTPGKIGWNTSITTKPLMIDELEQGLRTFDLHLRDPEAISELTFYKVDDQGKTGAPDGHFDDRVISRAIAFQLRKHLAQEPDESGVRAFPLSRFSDL